jgi:hypothetical protein
MDLEDGAVNGACMLMMQAIAAEVAKPEADPTRNLSAIRLHLEHFSDILA